MNRRGWDGCVSLTAALVEIPPADRLDALALFLDACIKTRWFTRSDYRVVMSAESAAKAKEQKCP